MGLTPRKRPYEARKIVTLPSRPSIFLPTNATPHGKPIPTRPDIFAPAITSPLARALNPAPPPLTSANFAPRAKAQRSDRWVHITHDFEKQIPSQKPIPRSVSN